MPHWEVNHIEPSRRSGLESNVVIPKVQSSGWSGRTAVAFALPAAVGFGVADFAGGLATRRSCGTLTVIALAQFAGAAVLLSALILVPGRPSAAAAGVGALAGLAGSLGLVWYFRGLARGPMGVVAPLSALTSAGLPLVVGVTAGESAGPVTVCGIAVALLAIALATAGTRHDQAAAGGLLLGIGSGVGFGVFFIALNATPPDSGLWPLLAAKVASVAVFGSLMLARRSSIDVTRRRYGLIVLSGTADMVANVLFLLATRAGALSVSAVLVSLYPVVVVVLARFVLRERLTWLQATSVALAVTASALLSG